MALDVGLPDVTSGGSDTPEADSPFHTPPGTPRGISIELYDNVPSAVVIDNPSVDNKEGAPEDRHAVHVDTSYELAESVWDMAFFLNTKPIGQASHCATITLNSSEHLSDTYLTPYLTPI